MSFRRVPADRNGCITSNTVITTGDECRLSFIPMARRKQVYKITYPNGKIYVGMDLTGSVTYFGSPSAKERIAADLGEHVYDYTARKQILWESDTATDAEVRAMEIKLIREHRANDPAIGYNLTPRWSREH